MSRFPPCPLRDWLQEGPCPDWCPCKRPLPIAERMAAQDRPTLRVLPWEDVEEVARPEETRS